MGNETAQPIEVPFSALSSEALQGVIESFILREGTDYGSQEQTLEKKVQDLRRQMERNEIRLVFDPSTESLTFLTQKQWRDLQSV